MNWLGTIFLSLFASNALLTWGFGFRSGFAAGQSWKGPWLGLLLLFNLLAATLLWALESFLLLPLGIPRLLPLVYLVLVLPALRLLARGLGALLGENGGRIVERGDELSLSTLVFGIALVALHGGSSLGEALLAALVSVLGWWSAVGLIGAIVRRSEAGSLPALLRGLPVVLLSAALLGMILSLLGLALGGGAR